MAHRVSLRFVSYPTFFLPTQDGVIMEHLAFLPYLLVYFILCLLLLLRCFLQFKQCLPLPWLARSASLFTAEWEKIPTSSANFPTSYFIEDAYIPPASSNANGVYYGRD